MKSSKFNLLTKDNFNATITNCPYEHWLIVAKPEYEDDIYFQELRIKLGSIFVSITWIFPKFLFLRIHLLIQDRLLCLGEIDCTKEKDLCLFLNIGIGKFYISKEAISIGNGVLLDNLNPQEISKQVLSSLPGIPFLSESSFEVSASTFWINMKSIL